MLRSANGQLDPFSLRGRRWRRRQLERDQGQRKPGNADSDANADAHTNANAHTDANANAHTDANANAHTDADADAHTDADADTNANAHTDADTDTDTNAHTNADTDTNAHTNAHTDTAPPPRPMSTRSRSPSNGGQGISPISHMRPSPSASPVYRAQTNARRLTTC
ncbi:hypothetical protein [Paraburkholderia sp. RL17-337-BIB-A]|uniref:hypothetical protein n=1 Tax=Paraburkholderia sp. RL17-337-BIB-A TaxID=3031636 RepID=UPI0038B6C937